MRETIEIKHMSTPCFYNQIREYHFAYQADASNACFGNRHSGLPYNKTFAIVQIIVVYHNSDGEQGVSLSEVRRGEGVRHIERIVVNVKKEPYTNLY